MKLRFRTGNFLLGILYAGIAGTIFVAAILVAPEKSSTQKIFLGSSEIEVSVADTPVLQERGLSGRKSLASNEGMFFEFPEPTKVGFWMKDMLFPIDIIWFDENRRIVDVWKNASPISYPQVVAPRVNAQYVIEVPDGFFDAHQLKFGDLFERR